MYCVQSVRFSNQAFKTLYLLGQTTTALWKILEDHHTYEDINLAQSRILNILMHHDRALTHAEICRYLYRESQTVGSSLNRLVEKGYVKRIADSNDKRCMRVYITEEGRQKVRRQYEWILPLCDEIASCFSDDELCQMDRSLDRLRNLLFDIEGIDLIDPLDGLCDVPAIEMVA